MWRSRVLRKVGMNILESKKSKVKNGSSLENSGLKVKASIGEIGSHYFRSPAASYRYLASKTADSRNAKTCYSGCSRYLEDHTNTEGAAYTTHEKRVALLGPRAELHSELTGID